MKTIQYTSDVPIISNIEEINNSFVRASLKVMYTGKNRNNTHFSKEAVEKALPSIKNVPIVCHYRKEEGCIGGHDMDLELTDEGDIQVINLTTPCGVVPDHAVTRFEVCTDNAGRTREYLVIDGVILWRREQSVQYLLNNLNGVCDHSMEIDVIETREMEDNCIDITNYQYTALCLLEADMPCFEGSHLTVYSFDDFRERYTAMLEEIKQLNLNMKGGNEALENEIKELDVPVVPEEVEQTKVIAEVVEPEAEVQEEAPSVNIVTDTPENVSPNNDNEEINITETEPVIVEAPEGQFALEEPRRCALNQAVLDCGYDSDGYSLYIFVDYDPELQEVYVYDTRDWNLYGFNFAINGDVVTIDINTKARKKFTIVPYEGSEPQEFSLKYGDCSVKAREFDKVTDELTKLREYKASVEKSIHEAAVKEVLDKFADISETEAFETLAKNASNLSVETLEEKCYAIRGRMQSAQYSLLEENKTPKLMAHVKNEEPIPYGGLFEKYGIV